MIFDLKAKLTFSNDISLIKNEIESSISDFNKVLLEKDKSLKIKTKDYKENFLSLEISSEGSFRPHNALLQMKNILSKEFGKKHHLGIRDITIEIYTIDFDTLVLYVYLRTIKKGE